MDVLIVDDDEAVVKLVERWVRRGGMVPHGFVNPHEALAFAATRRIDIALIDLHIGETRGVAVANDLARLQPLVQCVLLSGLPGATSFPFAAVLRKPFDAKTLLATIAVIVAGKSDVFAVGSELRANTRKTRVAGGDS